MVLTSRLSVVWQLMTWQACASHWYQSLMMVLSTALSREKGRRGRTMPPVTKSSTFRWDLNDIVWCKCASVGSIVTFPVVGQGHLASSVLLVLILCSLSSPLDMIQGSKAGSSMYDLLQMIAVYKMGTWMCLTFESNLNALYFLFMILVGWRLKRECVCVCACVKTHSTMFSLYRLRCADCVHSFVWMNFRGSVSMWSWTCSGGSPAFNLCKYQR